jgi:DNA/RNA-binding domain of Phe-tRNA-synthetase-like protein
VREAFPGYRAGVVAASGLTNGPSSPVEIVAADLDHQDLVAAELDHPDLVAAHLDHPHLVAWREAFRAFGAKPKRYQCSAEALIRRIVAGEGLPAVNRLVDLYNAVSVRWAVPVGGEDLDHVVGAVRLVFASGDEPFDGGDPPKPGEVVWADEAGVTCRRWNWRQGRRTRLEMETTRAYFLFDALPAFDDASLAGAMDDLAERLRAACPGARLETRVVS